MKGGKVRSTEINPKKIKEEQGEKIKARRYNGNTSIDKG